MVFGTLLATKKPKHAPGPPIHTQPSVNCVSWSTAHLKDAKVLIQHVEMGLTMRSGLMKCCSEGKTIYIGFDSVLTGNIWHKRKPKQNGWVFWVCVLRVSYGTNKQNTLSMVAVDLTDPAVIYFSGWVSVDEGPHCWFHQLSEFSFDELCFSQSVKSVWLIIALCLQNLVSEGNAKTHSTSTDTWIGHLRHGCACQIL